MVAHSGTTLNVSNLIAGERRASRHRATFPKHSPSSGAVLSLVPRSTSEDVDDAVAAYKQAIEADPRLAVAYNNLGAAYERQGQKELAKQYYQKAREKDPNFEDAKKNLQRLNGS